MREPVAIFRTLGFGFLVMGALALLLSAASIHALTACTVTRRTREIGIRQALGAGASRIVGDVLRRSVTQLALGTILGTALGLGLLQLSRVFPWEVRQANPTALGIVVAGLTLSGVVALAQPLRRALSIRPADAMRAE
jgi:putative ABC transport system permease protein